MDERRIDVLEGRLQRLERANLAMGRECRRWRLGAGGLVLAGLVLGVAGADSNSDQVPRKLEAQNFVLRDATGRTRASLGFRADGTPGFALMDELSRVRLALDLCGNGAPAVNFYSAEGKLLTALAVRPDGSPALGMFDSQGQVRASLDLSHEETAPGLSLYDREGTMRAAIAVRPDQTPGLGLFDPEGEAFLSLDADSVPNRPAPRSEAPQSR
jgi:hypothetical protein